MTNLPFGRPDGFRRRWRIVIGCGAASVVLLAGAVALRWTQSAKLNVVLITLDTTRADRIGCYGYAKARTTALDAIAGQGVRFLRAYAPAPITLPSHASILTGLYPPEHALHVNGRGRLDAGITVLAEILQQLGYETGAFVASFVLNSKFGLNRGFRTYDDDLSQSEPSHGSTPRRKDGRIVMDCALAWLESRGSHPFFCWVHLYDPHYPYLARPAAFGDEFAERPYDAGIAYADLQIERLRTFLRSHGLENRTLLVVVGDHGEGLMEHEEEEHGFQLYDSTLRVPLVMAGPSFIKAGHRVASPVSLVDIMPTILDCVGADRKSGMSGRSIKAALAGKAIEERPCYAETDVPLLENQWAPLRAVINGRWKYIETTRPELYDLDDDPNEKLDLVERQPGPLDQMRQALVAISRQMTTRSSVPVHLSDEERRVLESLGYAHGESESSQAPANARLPDVKDMMAHFNAFSDAKDLLEGGKVDQADAKLRDLLGKVPDYSLARAVLGDVCLRQHNFSEAIEAYEAALVGQPHRAETHANLGNALAAQGNFDAAVPHYRRALQLEPDSPAFHYWLASTLWKLGRRDESKVEFEEAIRCNSHFVDAHLRLADILVRAGRLDEARHHYDMAMQLNPSRVIARGNRSDAQAAPDDHAESVKRNFRKVQSDPSSTDAHIELGESLFLARRYEEALMQFDEALRQRPDDTRARDSLERAKSALAYD